MNCDCCGGEKIVKCGSLGGGETVTCGGGGGGGCVGGSVKVAAGVVEVKIGLRVEWEMESKERRTKMIRVTIAIFEGNLGELFG